MSLPKTLSFILLCLTTLGAAPGFAQTTPEAASKPRVTSSPGFVLKREIHFSGAKPVLGLPTGDVAAHAHCSNDGINFLDVYPNSAAALPGPSMPELYSVSSTAGVKHLMRKIPVDYNTLSVRDFFVADHTLVTLLRAERRDDQDTTSPPRDVRYFVSLSDYDGDQASLLSLDLRFKPLKVALFGSGDFLVLGWDESNLLPLLAVLKPEGTIRRFIDLDLRSAEFYKTYSPIKEAESAPDQQPDLATLQRAAFVPFGSQVMLTYPGTTKGFLVLSPVSEGRSIPAALPGGFVMHDVLPGADRQTLVLRVEEKRESPPTGKDVPASKPLLRIFEMSLSTGALLREFHFDKPSVADITCAPSNKLMAIFYDTVANVVQPADANGNKPAQSTENATQLVIATSPR